MTILFLIVFIIAISFIVTLIEIVLEYPRRFELAFKSKYSLCLLLFNIIIALIIFFINRTDNSLKFIHISNMWILAILSGVSGYLFFNSKMNIDKILQNHDLSSLKSFFSGVKSNFANELRSFIEVDYPFELAEKICLKFNYKRINDYINFVERTINHFLKANQQKQNELFIKLYKNIDTIDEKKKVYYLTNILFEIKEPGWINREVFKRFCDYSLEKS